jgi:hypothetical protein
VEAEQTGGKLKITYISLEVMNSTAERILVLGDKSKHHMKSELRDLLNFKTEKTKA